MTIKLLIKRLAGYEMLHVLFAVGWAILKPAISYDPVEETAIQIFKLAYVHIAVGLVALWVFIIALDLVWATE